MYKLSIAFLLIVVLLIGCGGPKKETPIKPASSATSEFVAMVKMVEPMTVLSIEKKGPYNMVGKAINELMSWIMVKQIKPIGAPFGIYYDDPLKVIPESTRYEVCVPVLQDTKGEKTFKVKQLPAMEVAYTMHIGPYEKVGETYGKLSGWIEKNSYTIVGPAREIYVSNPSVPPDSLRTEIQFPVRKKS